MRTGWPTLVGGALLATRCGSSPWTVRPFRVVEARTPAFRVVGYDTTGTFPQVRGAASGLIAVNQALRGAVIADQDAESPSARAARARLSQNHAPAGPWRGVYRTAVDPTLVSASTVVVSALLPTSRELFIGQPGGDGWLSLNIRVSTGKPFALSELFNDQGLGLAALANAWRKRLRLQGYGGCLRAYRWRYATSLFNYRQFALPRAGLQLVSMKRRRAVEWKSLCPTET